MDLKGNGKRGKNKKEENHKNMHKLLPTVDLKDGQQENVLWIPPYLIFDVITNDMKTRGHDILGPDFERYTVRYFHSVLDKFEPGSRNLTVLAGWKHTWGMDGSTSGIGEEHDMLIIDGHRHIILNFEIKYQIVKNGSFLKAKDQLHNQTKYFEDFHSELQLGGWSFINVIVYKENENVNLCTHCEFYTLNEEKMQPESLKVWFDKVREKIPIRTTPAKISYEEVVERFVGPSTKSKDFFCNERQIRDREHKNLTGSNEPVATGILTGTLKGNKQMKTNAEAAKKLLSEEEKQILDEKCGVVLEGDYGTGKTYHIVEKIKKLVEKGEKVVLLVGNMFSQHRDLVDQMGKLEGAVVLNKCLARDFEKLKNSENIKIHHPGSEVFCHPLNHKYVGKRMCLEKLENYLKQGYHLFFDEFRNIRGMEEDFLVINDLVALFSKYNTQTMWIAMRPDSCWYKVPLKGFDVVKLKVNFRNSPKIVQWVKDLFAGYFQEQPVSHFRCAESVFVSLNKKRLDGGSPKLFFRYFCEYDFETLNAAFEKYKGDNVILVGLENFHKASSTMDRKAKKNLEEQISGFTFVPLWKYNKEASNTCFFHLATGGYKFCHDIWNGIEVKNLIVYAGCIAQCHLGTISTENMRSLLLRASVSLTVIVCRHEEELWAQQRRGLPILNIPERQMKNRTRYFENCLLDNFEQFMENTNDGAMAAPRTDNLLIWDAVIFGPDGTPFEGGIFRLWIGFEDDYMFSPPVFKFITEKFHPNISTDGKICLKTFKWEEFFSLHDMFDVTTIMTKVLSLLRKPELYFSDNPVAAKLFKENQSEYKKLVRACVEQSLDGNLDQNQVRAEWKERQEDFLRKRKEEKESKE